MNLPDLIDDEALAGVLGCTTETVQERALAGDFPGLKIGRSWVFPREALLDALNRAARLQAEGRAVVRISKPAGVVVTDPTPTPSRRRAPVALPDLPAA